MGRGVTDDPTWTKRFLQELAYHLAPLVDGSIAPEDEISIAQAFFSNQPHCFCARKEQQWRQRIGALKCIGMGDVYDPHVNKVECARRRVNGRGNVEAQAQVACYRRLRGQGTGIYI